MIIRTTITRIMITRIMGTRTSILIYIKYFGLLLSLTLFQVKTLPTFFKFHL
jgi:hypothetical protein